MSDLETEHDADDDHLEVRAYTEQTFRDLDGDETTQRTVKHKLVLPADEEAVEALAHEMLGWVHEESGGGPPGQKPLHQQYAAAEPDR